jgi:glyoxylate/hydroxypyruvate reductase
LRWVQSLWAGVERLAPETPAHVAIVRMTDPQLAETMAEAVLAWTLFLHRDMPHYAACQRTHAWRPRRVVRAEDRTVGVLGLGNMGRLAAERLRDNGFAVLGWSGSRKTIAGVETLSGDGGFASVLQRSDIVVLLLPLTAATRGLIGREALRRFKTGASLINFARGAIVDDEALLARLDEGALTHAVLDVFAAEPLPAGSPFWSHERVTVLPHVSAPTTMSTASAIVADNLRRYFADGRLPAPVDRNRGY